MKLSDDQKFILGTNARKIVENSKGIVAADETPKSLKKRFDIHGIDNSEENRRKFRELLIKTRGISEKVGGMILHEETFTQCDDNGKMLVDILIEKNISVGIKLDKGLVEFNENEFVSSGLEDLDAKCKNPDFSKAGFCKWRSLFILGDKRPTDKCIDENCSILAEYAEIAQKNNLIPIVEPEILWDGNYSHDKCMDVHKMILSKLVYYLNLRGVYIPGILVKTSFTSPGKMSENIIPSKDIGLVTFDVLLSTIPCGVPGIVFLSGGHPSDQSIEYLERVNSAHGPHTWSLSFSFGRALTDPAMECWKGNDKNIENAQKIFLNRVELCYQAIQKNK